MGEQGNDLYLPTVQTTSRSYGTTPLFSLLYSWVIESNKFSLTTVTNYPQTYWLNTTQIYHLIVLSVRTLLQVTLGSLKVLTGCIPSGALEENPVPCLFSS